MGVYSGIPVRFIGISFRSVGRELHDVLEPLVHNKHRFIDIKQQNVILGFYAVRLVVGGGAISSNA